MDWSALPTINTSRLSLRWITEHDVDAFYAVYSHPEVMRYWSFPALTERDQAAKLVSEIHDGFRRQAVLKWGIARLTDNILIGSITLFNLDFTHRRAEIGYALSHDHWRQGYMQEALTAVIAFAFAELGLHRIEADVDPRNDASIRTVERLGFQREGYLRERWQVGGEIQDALFFGLLRPDWEALRLSQ